MTGDLADASKPLWITEGVLKGDAAVTVGLACIALHGVDAWQSRGAPLPDWDHIALAARDVFIAYDSDVMTKDSVGRALRDLTLYLIHRGAQVRWKFLPEGTPDVFGVPAKTGLDDFLAQPRDVTDLLALPEATPRLEELEREEVEKRARDLRIARAAHETVEREEAMRSFRLPPSRVTLRDELEVADGDLAFTVDALHPTGSNTLLGAQYKKGKTTLLCNLYRSLIDQQPFLGELEVAKPRGRVAYWNYELSDRQFRNWLHELGIENSEAGSVWNLRGARLPLNVPLVEERLVEWLVQRDVSVLIIDPFTRAYAGDENSNHEVGRFLDTLDVIKREAGIDDLFMAAHFGRMEQEVGSERVRGAARLDDWADVRWILTGAEDRRYFYADGRDVRLDEVALDYVSETRSLRIGSGSRREDRHSRNLERASQRAVEAVAQSEGLTASELRACMTGDKNIATPGVKAAVAAGLIVERVDGRTKRYYLPDKEQ